MRLIYVIVLASTQFASPLLAAARSGASPATKEKATCERSLLDGEITSIELVSQFPSKIQEFLSEVFADQSDSGLSGIAEPGTPFNVTDAIEPNLPWRRYIVGGRQAD